MSDTDTMDISSINFSSTVFPTDEDMAVWNSLTPEQQRAIIMRKVEKGLSGAPTSKASKSELMAEVLGDGNCTSERPAHSTATQ